MRSVSVLMKFTISPILCPNRKQYIIQNRNTQTVLCWVIIPCSLAGAYHKRVTAYLIRVYPENFVFHFSQVKHLLNKAIPLQAWTGPEGSRRLRLPAFKTIGT